jgi:hypothetical protein
MIERLQHSSLSYFDLSSFAAGGGSAPRTCCHLTSKEPRLPKPDTTPATTPNTAPADPAAQEEARLLRRLQLMMNLVLQTITQDSSLSIDEASQMIADARSAALNMFPGKELAYDLIWRPRFQRLMRERFRIM